MHAYACMYMLGGPMNSVHWILIKLRFHMEMELKWFLSIKTEHFQTTWDFHEIAPTFKFNTFRCILCTIL